MSTPRSQDKFIWPPSESSTAEPSASPLPRAVPPAPAAAQSPASDGPRIIEPKPKWRAILHDIERTWLDVTTPTLKERLMLASWSPDPPTAYCPTCGSSVGPHEVTDIHGRPSCQTCRGKRLPWDRTIRLGEYNGLLRDVVHETKFTGWRAVGSQIGALLGQSISEALQDAAIEPHRAVLVPVPTTFRRRMARGIDHSLVLARGAARTSGCRIIRPLARRHRPSQVSLPRSKRTANVAGTIRPHTGVDLSGLCVIVLDDVKTTGATLRAACRAIRKTGPADPKGPDFSPEQIWTAVLAVAADGSRARRESEV